MESEWQNNIGSTRNVYRIAGAEVAERILGLGDRREGSDTAGCYDRMFWKYRLIDYPSLWFQSVSGYLALLWSMPEIDFFKAEKIRTWCVDACNFTTDHLNPDGSCVEVYPFERNFCATAFVLGYICMGLSLINESKVPLKTEKMGYFLCKNIGNRVSNQLAAAALALFRLAKLSNNDDFYAAGRNKLELLYNNQIADGYFHEYDGLDAGYLSVTLSLLAQLENEFPDEVDRKRAERASAVFLKIINDNGTYDYSSMSRGTQYLYPFGLAFWNSPLLARLEKGLYDNRAIRPSWLDDRYVTNLAIDYLYLSKWLQQRSQ